MNHGEAIKVAVIDREGFYIDAVMSVLAQQPDIEIVGSATIKENFANDAHEAEIIVLQNETVPLTRELIQEIQCELPEARVVILGAPDDDDVLISYIECGAIGYVRSTEDFDQLMQVIRIVRSGEAVVHPGLVAPLCRRLSEVSRMMREIFPVDLDGIELTPRQEEVISLLVKGHSNQEIADELDISIGTVKNHVHKIFSQLGVSSREQAAAIYTRLQDEPKAAVPALVESD
ncbi:MAG: response regulator transcription factor [Thermomicrobiales bacterium]